MKWGTVFAISFVLVSAIGSSPLFHLQVATPQTIPNPPDLARSSSSGSTSWVGAYSSDPAALPNTGVRTTTQVISLQVTGCLSYWISDDLSNNMWGQVGYVICNGSSPFAFFQIWNLTSNQVVCKCGNGLLLNTGDHTFTMAFVSGTTWSFAVDTNSLGTYDMRASVSSSTYPVYALSEESTSSVFAIPSVTFSTAMLVLRSGAWAPVPTALSYGTAWGVQGQAQNSALSANEIVVGTSIPQLTQGTLLWGSGASTTSTTSLPAPTSTATVTVTTTSTKSTTLTATTTATSISATTATSTATHTTTATYTTTSQSTITQTVTQSRTTTITNPTTTTTTAVSTSTALSTTTTTSLSTSVSTTTSITTRTSTATSTTVLTSTATSSTTLVTTSTTTATAPTSTWTTTETATATTTSTQTGDVTAISTSYTTVEISSTQLTTSTVTTTDSENPTQTTTVISTITQPAMDTLTRENTVTITTGVTIGAGNQPTCQSGNNSSGGCASQINPSEPSLAPSTESVMAIAAVGLGIVVFVRRALFSR